MTCSPIRKRSKQQDIMRYRYSAGLNNLHIQCITIMINSFILPF